MLERVDDPVPGSHPCCRTLVPSDYQMDDQKIPDRVRAKGHTEEDLRNIMHSNLLRLFA